ncbi:MAG TPA: PilZ domain-containing protein [Myxococcales bacterium]|nr:PilZ domain-containing protein [Myxococcales bacterium]
MEEFNAPLRYRFDHLEQARAHVVRAGGHSLFFFRHPRLSLEPGSSVQVEWTFQNAEPARMLHGIALENVDRCGVWMELHDTRPLRELSVLHSVRRHRRMATDRPVQVVCGDRTYEGRLLDVSAGGARITGAPGVLRGDLIELRLPSDQDPSLSQELGSAYVAWADESGEMGVQFDRLDSSSRTAVIDLVRSVADAWASALESRHPSWCCVEAGPIEVPLPEGFLRAAG